VIENKNMNIFSRFHLDSGAPNHNQFLEPSTNDSKLHHSSQFPVTPEIQVDGVTMKLHSPVSPEENFDLSNLPAKSSFAFDMYPDLPTRYKLQSILGEGAFSTVYSAWDSEQNITVAIKIINKVNLSQKQLKNINNEITIMKKLKNHPNILQLLDSFSSRTHAFLVLEYSNGGEIFNKILEYTYFSEPLSRHVFLQLLSSIDYLHSRDIVHRDIKPENLLFTKIPYFPREVQEFKSTLRKSDDANKKDEGRFKPFVGGGTIGQIKLADFGLAKQLHITHNALKTPCGTAGYTAPEVISCNDLNEPTRFSVDKKNYYNKSVDIWSLGCFLYTMLCGFPPFYDDDPNQLTRKILNGDYVFLKPWWDEISDDVKDLITKMLDTNPMRRISIAEIWEHPWVVGTDSCGDEVKQSYFYKVIPSNESDEGFEQELVDEDCPNTFLGLHLSNQPLLSPQATAIKKVFDNPAMTGNNESSYSQSTVHFIENISEEDYESDGPFCTRRKSLVKAMKSPFPDKIHDVKFRSVFNDNCHDEDNFDYEDTDSDATDELTSLNKFQVKLVGAGDLLSKSKLEPPGMSDDDDGLSSTIEDDDEAATSEDSEYQTRSSSIISGIAGDFKFTLNLNDSNLLSRRRSSTISKKHAQETEISKCVC
jgi:serine/threonine protein kinase